MNKHINVKNAVQAHIRQHLEWFVDLHVEKGQDGNIYSKDQDWPLRKGDLYVDAQGILREVKAIKKAKTKKNPGVKNYTIYLYEHKKGEWSLSPIYRMTETKFLKEIGVKDSFIVASFDAASHKEAIKKLESLKHYYRTPYGWSNRENIPLYENIHTWANREKIKLRY